MAEHKTFILHITGPENSWDFTLPEGGTTAGREAGVELQLAHPLVSRKHARFDCSVKDCTVTDLGSANGTLINGEPVAPNTPTAIAAGNQLGIGPFEISVEVVVEERADAAEAPSPKKGAAAAPKEAKPAAEKPAKAAKGSAKPAKAEKPVPAKEPEKTPPASAEGAGGVPPGSEPPEGPPGVLEPDVIPSDRTPPGITLQSQRLLQQLPGIYHTDFMSRFLGLFEATLMPIEWTVDNFELFLTPGTAPTLFLPWLANWYEIIYDSTWNEAQRRTLLKEAHQIYSRRGTRWALNRVLEIYLGKVPEIEEFKDERDPYTFTIKLPVRSGQYSQELIERLVDASKPAHTNYTLQFKN